MSSSEESTDAWWEAKEPQSGRTCYVNIERAQVAFERPPDTVVKDRDAAVGEWWELTAEGKPEDESAPPQPVYQNSASGEKVTEKPTSGLVVPVSLFQKLTVDEHAAPPPPPPTEEQTSSAPAPNATETSAASEGEGAAAAADESGSKVAQLEAKRSSGELLASGSHDFANAKLAPGWTMSFDAISGRNYYSHAERQLTTWSRAVAVGTADISWTNDPKDPPPVFVPVTDRSSTLKAARAKGIGEPVLNRAAATAMSPINPANAALPDQTAPPPLASEHSLPGDISEQIMLFQLEGYAKKYFAKHKRGLFRRRVPVESLLTWTKDPITIPLLQMGNKHTAKAAVNHFKSLQKALGDKSEKGSLRNSSFAIFQQLIEEGILNGQLRDELYVQLCKQLNQNPNVESERKGWQLMSCYVISFPPSKDLEKYIVNFFTQHEKPAGHELAMFPPFCRKKFLQICQKGPRGKTLTIPEIERAVEAVVKPSVFGETLQDIMDMQRETHPDLDIPLLLKFLAENILRLGGEKTEGIFRIPGDGDAVALLRLKIENNEYDISDIKDPAVPASLLKLWLRELAEPLIPDDKYSDAIQFCEETAKILSLVESLPDINRKTVHYLAEFLQTIGRPENQPNTKMSLSNLGMVFAPNFLRCPSENPQTLLENSKYEQNFVRNVLVHLKTPKNLNPGSVE